MFSTRTKLIAIALVDVSISLFRAYYQKRLDVGSNFNIYAALILIYNFVGHILEKVLGRLSLYEVENFEREQWIRYSKMDQKSKDASNIHVFNEIVSGVSSEIMMKYGGIITNLINTISSIISLVYMAASFDCLQIVAISVVLNAVWFKFVTLPKWAKFQTAAANTQKTTEMLRSKRRLNMNYQQTKTMPPDEISNLSNRINHITKEQRYLRVDVVDIQKYPTYATLFAIPLFVTDTISAALLVNIMSELNKSTIGLLSFYTMANKMPAIRLENFWKTKTFLDPIEQIDLPEKFTIDFDGLSGFISGKISITQGCRYHVRGLSGSGKSTMLKMLVGINPGAYVDKISTQSFRSNIAYMSQNIREFTEVDAVSIRDLFKMSPNDGMILECLKIAELESWFSKTMNNKFTEPIKNQLSGGEKTRLCIAITIFTAIVEQCKCIVFDEPEQGVDTDLAAKIIENIGNKFAGTKTIIMATHLRQCDTGRFDAIWTIKDGKLEVSK